MIVRARTFSRLALAATLASPLLHANGRFPAAGHLLVGPGESDGSFVLRTTFGLALTTDRGARWSWVCEEALGAVGEFDPTTALASDGAITLGLPDGLRVSTVDRCGWSAPAGSMARVLDVTQSATGEVLLAAAGAFVEGATPYSVVLRSRDGGRSWTLAARLDRFFVETVDLAPRDPTRVYVSGANAEARPTILRSNDGGDRFAPVAATLPSNATPYLAAVSRTNPDRLWVRTTEGLGSGLYRSDDGGASLTRVAASAAPMTGFAVSDDDRRVWWGTSERGSGMQRSVDGAPFARVGPPIAVRCLRFHRDTLFVCADEASDGYSLGWSRDLGETVAPWMSLRDLQGPLPGCGDGGVSGRCEAPWATLGPRLRDLDAATAPARVPLDPPDAGGDAASDAPDDEVTLDAAAARDVGSPAPTPAAGCACAARGNARGSAPGGIALAALARRRRRRRRG
ncbi:MAG: hypothetical protein R3A48_08525 [Polyangiales bacterium]